ncbi:hypothetical protein ACFTAO_46295 [Paenibacillus rhizoplanae]
MIDNDGKLLWGQFASEDLALIRSQLTQPNPRADASIRLSNGNSYLLIDKPSQYSNLNVFFSCWMRSRFSTSYRSSSGSSR